MTSRLIEGPVAMRRRIRGIISWAALRDINPSVMLLLSSQATYTANSSLTGIFWRQCLVLRTPSRIPCDGLRCRRNQGPMLTPSPPPTGRACRLCYPW